MHRRDALVGTAGVVAALAGCLSDEGSPGGDDSDTDGTDGRAETADDPRIDGVELDTLLPGVVETTSPDSVGVRGDADSQYLYLNVTVAEDADPIPGDDFTFALGGRDHGRATYDHEFEHWRSGDGSGYSSDTGTGWLLFELPEAPDDPGACALQWPGGEWAAGESLRERLVAPIPDTSVSVTVPETLAVGDQPTLSVTIANEGEYPVDVPLAVNRVGPRIAYAPLNAARITVPAGETTTWEWTDGGVDFASEEDSATYHVHWHEDSVSGDVEATA